MEHTDQTLMSQLEACRLPPSIFDSWVRVPYSSEQNHLFVDISDGTILKQIDWFSIVGMNLLV